jgi:hypothetical protein
MNQMILPGQAFPGWLNGRVTTLLFLSSLTIGRLIVQIRLYQQGFVSVSADEFARGLRAVGWSQHLRVAPFADLISPWPPFEMYLNGLALRIFGDVLITPRITVFAASSLLLVTLFFLIRYLFASDGVAALALIFVAVQPWYIWLSGTPMLEMYFLASFMAGLYFLVTWLREKRRFYWLFAGLLFLLASGFHVQSWVLINVVNLFTFLYSLKQIPQRDYKGLGQLLLFWLLGNTFILFSAMAEYMMSGQIFGILASHTNYSLWFYGGYTVTPIEKLLYYPRIVWGNIPFLAFLIGGSGLLQIWRGQERAWRLVPLGLGCFALAAASCFNMMSGPPSAAPDRYSLFYTMLLAPYVAYGVYSLAQQAWQFDRTLPAYLSTTLIAALFFSLVALQLAQAVSFPKGMSSDTIATGRYLNETLTKAQLSQSSWQPTGNLMVELVYWDYLALQLMVQQREKLLFDREVDYLNREIPSLFLENEADIRAQLLKSGVEWVALKNPVLTERAEALAFLVRERDVGAWTIFRLVATP